MMQYIRGLKTYLLVLVVCIGHAVPVASAQIYYKWVDADGNITYQDFPPPEETDFQEKKYIDSSDNLQTPEGEQGDLEALLETAVSDSPATLYSIPDCEACDLARIYLESLSVPFSEKAIHDDPALQQELKELSGELLVPTVIIGDKIIDGYSKSSLYEALSNKGYPLDLLKLRDEEAAGQSGEEG